VFSLSNRADKQGRAIATKCPAKQRKPRSEAERGESRLSAKELSVPTAIFIGEFFRFFRRLRNITGSGGILGSVGEAIVHLPPPKAPGNFPPGATTATEKLTV